MFLHSTACSCHYFATGLERAAGCDPSLAHLPMPYSLASFSVLATYPCHASLPVRALHIVQHGSLLTTWASVIFHDVVFAYFITANLCALLAMLLAPK